MFLVFDVDGTLCESKSDIDTEMGELLSKLSSEHTLVFITGGKYEQVQSQVLDLITKLEPPFYVLSLSGAEALEMTDKRNVYLWRNLLEDEERGEIIASIIHVLNGHTPFLKWGEIMEERGSQITVSLLGQTAPWYVKKFYDPNLHMRMGIVEKLKIYLDDRYDIRVGGSTSIDITKKGLDKGNNLQKLVDHLGICKEKFIYIGDKLMKGGNDYPVKQTGFICIEVKSVHETKEFIKNYLMESSIDSDIKRTVVP